MSDAAIFAAVRDILIARTGKGLTQPEVDKLKRALMTTIQAASPSGNGRGVTAQLIAFLHGFESLRLTAYPDPGPTGLPVTNGWGSTTDMQGRKIVLGTVWTREYADAKFAQDLARFELGVNTLLGSAPTTQQQFDALVSFAYNVGLDIDDDNIAEGLGDSTLLKKHLRGDYAGAAAEFVKWNRAKGKVMNGLTRRRNAEADIYTKGVYQW